MNTERVTDTRVCNLGELVQVVSHSAQFNKKFSIQRIRLFLWQGLFRGFSSDKFGNGKPYGFRINGNFGIILNGHSNIDLYYFQ